MNNDEKRQLCLSVEGNIGAGKSTFLTLIKDRLCAEVVYEPHQKWQDIGGHNLLEKFYSDTNRWAYTFQSYAFITRILTQEKAMQAGQHAAYILERSVYSDRYCFAKNCYEMGVMTSLEWQLYQEWFSWLIERSNTPLHGFIYLKTDPEICYQRLVKRNRTEEATVSLDYLRMIHSKHEKWLIDRINIDKSLHNVPVLVLECNADFEHDNNEQEKHMRAISEFFAIEMHKPEIANYASCDL